MEHEEICGRIQQYLESAFPNPSMELTWDTSLLDGWFIDSMGVVSVVIFLEKEFGCDIQAADVNAVNFETIQSLARFVASCSPMSCSQ